MIDPTSIIINLLIFLASLVVFIILFFKWSYSYWDRKGLESAPPRFPFGSVGNIVHKEEHVDVTLSKIYRNLKKRGLNHGGYYVLNTPLYMPVDPEYIKNILVRDFQSFVNRNMYYNEKDDPLSAHLVNLRGNKWRSLRTKLTPTFTSGKMKVMFQTFLDCSEQFLEVLNRIVDNGEPVEIKDAVGCFTTDIIGSCAFGIECNTLKNPQSEFRKYGKGIFYVDKTKLAKLMLCARFPKMGRFFGVKMIAENVSNFFSEIVTKNVEYREKNNIYRKDFLQLLVDTRIKQSNGAVDESVSLTMNEIKAQSYIFFAAGFETSSTTMSFCLFELASNPEVQETLREEIETVLQKYNGEICYDAVMEMSYLNKVVHETLRKHPSIAQLVRRCTKTYKVPDTDLVIQKGIDVVISSLGVHYDPEFYPDPERFDPERFSEENIAQRPPCTFLPFGDGPRNCIGLRFGLLQVKVGVIGFIKNYRFSVNSKTSIPLKLDKQAMLYSAEGGIWLDLKKI